MYLSSIQEKQQKIRFMRQRFELQKEVGRRLIEDTPSPRNSRDPMVSIVIALRELYKNKLYRDQILDILEKKLVTGRPKTGRPGMDLWTIFVLAQLRLSKRLSYGELHTQANYNQLVRQVMGIEMEESFGFEEVPYQTIYDNVSLLDDETVREINEVVVSFGHGEVFKKKETEPLRVKTDSFVVESNVHFPTDYNLLWDCVRKCLDTIDWFTVKYQTEIPGWRKTKYWRKTLKTQMRKVGKANSSGGKNKAERLKKEASEYISQSKSLSEKLLLCIPTLPIRDVKDLASVISLEQYLLFLNKHIDLVERRLVKGEIIPHEEKMFSIFETCTEWITKGKLRPAVELGKRTTITSDQFQLILDYEVVDNKTDEALVLDLAYRLIKHFIIQSWSFDKGYWHPVNRALLEEVIPELVLPKKGKCNQQELEREQTAPFKKLRNKHSAVESNINSLENRGLSRCPDKGKEHFMRYVGLAVVSYNLCCIGRKLQKDYRKAEQLAQANIRKNAA
jgi:hypothetical protein